MARQVVDKKLLQGKKYLVFHVVILRHILCHMALAQTVIIEKWLFEFHHTVALLQFLKHLGSSSLSTL